MYGLPIDFEPRAFVGQELVQVSFTINTVHLIFDKDTTITIESTYAVGLSPDTAAMKQSPPVKSSNLMALLGRKVTEANATVEGTLTLVFEGHEHLWCFDDSEQYESYHIRIQEREIIV